MKTTAEYTKSLEQETEKIIVGKRRQIDLILMALFSGGHVLLNDLPGSGKTTLVKTLSIALGCDFRRLQFTPDLLPSDIVGMTVFNQKTSEFELVKGPVHTNILLTDEINRAIPRTQSALLEAMEEGQTTIDRKTLSLPRPFLVMATQNPVERESTFMLPAVQMDRFFICISLGYPELEEEMAILDHLGDGTPFEEVQSVTNPETLLQIREEIHKVTVSDDCLRYIVSLVQATRTSAWLRQGASPRASRCLYQGGKAYAAIQGRDYVIPEDIKAIWQPVMCHRVVPTGDPMKKINWRLLSASGQMITNIYETVQPGCIAFVLDLQSFRRVVEKDNENGRPVHEVYLRSGSMERMLSMVAACMTELSARRIQVALIVPGYGARSAVLRTPQEGYDILSECMEELALIDYRAEETIFPYEEFWQENHKIGTFYFCTRTDGRNLLSDLAEQLGKSRAVFLALQKTSYGFCVGCIVPEGI